MHELKLNVGGRPMRCLTTGAGRPLLLCHGFLSSAEEFGGRFGALAAHRRLIIPDLPGNGESAPLKGQHTAQALAATLEELLLQLDVTEFDVAGLCLGASVASALGARCGSRIGRVVLHTPLIAPSLVRRRFRAQVRVLTMTPLWQGVVALSRSRTVSDLYKRFVIEEGEVDGDTANVNFDNQRRADPGAAREWLRDSVQHGDLEALLRMKVPTLVILAGHDQVIDVCGLQRRIAAHPQIKIFVDTQQGHGWNPEAVERQTRVMLDFFDGGASGASTAREALIA
jgi:pimeloyl-ACP methyl ester carboxylesterase